jgi:diguanylate cyclase (GGDEF)-like protein
MNRSSRRAPRPEPGADRRHGPATLRTVGQVWVLAVVSVVAVVALAGVTLVRAADLRDRQRQAVEEFVPAVRGIALVQSAFAVLPADYRTILDAPTDPATLKRLTEANTQHAITAMTRWNAYKADPVRVRGETAMRHRFEQLEQQRYQVLTDTYFLTGAAKAANASKMETIEAEQAAILARLGNAYGAKIDNGLAQSSDGARGIMTSTLVIAGVSLVALFTLFGVVLRAARRRQVAALDLDRRRATRVHRDELEARFQRALELAATEEDTYPRIRHALAEAAPGAPLELLVADSSRAHFHQVVTTSPDDTGFACPVGSPTECASANRGQTQVYPSSGELDACAYMHESAGGACSAVCVPVSIAGKTVGVIHASAPDHEPLHAERIADVEVIARRAGERIGMLRAFARSETQARTDQLTGLLNRRSLELQVREITNNNRAYAVAFVDLDEFKQLNDVHGHESGDRALRLFARILRDSVRPSDIPARFGGDEFVVVLPDCGLDEATVVVDRVRARLDDVLASGDIPPFRASFGIAASEGQISFSQALERADKALLDAKAGGRDRVAVSGRPQAEPPAAA